MDTPDLAIITGGGAGLAALGRWAVGLWATVRRESIEAAKLLAERQIAAAKDAAAAQRADNDRMVSALLESAKAQTALAHTQSTLAGKIDQLPRLLALVIAEASNRSPSEVFDRLDPEEIERERGNTPQSSPIPIRPTTASEGSERRRPARRFRTPPRGSGTD
jgi:hypothetical protein